MVRGIKSQLSVWASGEEGQPALGGGVSLSPLSQVLELVGGVTNSILAACEPEGKEESCSL